MLKSIRFTGFASLLMALLVFSPANAEQQHAYDRISFGVSAEKEVENDILTAILFASQTGQDTAILADTVNQDISWALAIAEQEDSIDSRTLGYTTNPVYKNSRIDGWQVRQSIELKSKDSEKLSNLLGQLQSKLSIGSINYSISTEVRRSTEEMLISEALATFKNRASQVQTNMERAEYRVVRLNINTASDFHRPRAMARGATMMMAESAPAAPSLDAGKQKVQVRIDAEIELSAN